MFIQKQRTFLAIIIVLCLLVNAYAQQQPAENIEAPSTVEQSTVPAAPTDAGQQTQLQTEPVQPQPTENNATPADAEQSTTPTASTDSGQQAQPQSEPVQPQSSENNTTPSDTGQSTAPTAPTDSGQQTQSQPAPSQPQPTENNTTQSTAGQPTTLSSPSASEQQAQTQTTSAQSQTPVQIVIQQPAPAPASVSSNNSLTQIVLYTLLVIIVIAMLTRKEDKTQETALKIDSCSEDTDNLTDLPFYCDGVLNGKRFEPCSDFGDSISELESGSDFEKFEFSIEALKEAKKQTNDFLNKLDNSLILSSKSDLSSISRADLQNIADSVQDNMLKRICHQNSFWIKAIWSDKTPPNSDQLRLFIKNLLKPIQVPDGNVIQLTPSPWRVGIISVVGAIIGVLLSILLSLCHINNSALIAMLIGTGLFSSLIFWIVSNKARKDNVIIGMGAGLAAYWIFYLILKLPKKLYKKWSFGDKLYGRIIERFNLGTKENSGLFKALKSTTIGICFAILILKFLEFPIKFDKEEYEKKLQRIYYERIQAIVMLLATVKCNVDRLNTEFASRITEKDEQIRSMRHRIDELIDGEEIDIDMCNCFREFWDVDIKRLVNKLEELRQLFVSNGYEGLPKDCEAMLCMRQLNDLLTNTTNPKDFPKPESEPRILVWSEELEIKYKPLGLIEPGETVVVKSEPVMRNGGIAKKGEVIRKRD